jgi:amidohydrolase
MISEDFALFAQEIPAMYYFVGVTPPGVPASLAAANHSSRFQIDEAALLPALRTTVHLAFDYMAANGK